MTLIIVLWVAITQQFYLVAPNSQESCQDEAIAILNGIQKQFPEQEFKVACVSDKFLKKSRDA